MTYTETKNGYILRFFRDEEIMSTLTKFCEKENVASASFVGIGATKSAVFGYYDLDKKEYFFQTFNRLMEVVSMQGNVSLLDKKPFLHVHATFGDTDLKLYGGHVKEMTAGVTVEVHFTKHEADVKRKPDTDIGLNLLELPCHFTH